MHEIRYENYLYGFLGLEIGQGQHIVYDVHLAERKVAFKSVDANNKDDALGEAIKEVR